MRRLLQRSGFDIVRHPRPHGLVWNVRRALHHRPVDLVVDVGAHRGGFVRSLRQDVRYAGPVVSFEPMRESFAALAESRAGDPWWTGHNIAIGSREGVLPLHIYGGTDLNSFRKASAFGQRRFSHLALERFEEVPVRRLDDVLAGTAGRIMLKSDTQGYDLEVLRGAEGIMGHVDILLIELSVIPIYERMPDLADMVRIISELGLVSAGMNPVTFDGASVIEYDGVFVRRSRV